MMQHLWSVLSKKSIIDSSSNSISILEVVDAFKIDITVPKNLDEIKNISVPLEFELTSLWYRESSEGEYSFDFKIELQDPSNKKISKFENVLVFPNGKKRLRSQLKIQGLPINDSGVYKFLISFKDKKMKAFQNALELPIDIILNKKIGEELRLLTSKEKENFNFT